MKPWINNFNSLHFKFFIFVTKLFFFYIFSMGGHVAIMFTSMFPELVDKLVSLDSVKQVSRPSETISPRFKSFLIQFQELVYNF